MNPGRLQEILSRFCGLRLLVFGDYFLDKYLDIDRSLEEVSLETGLPAHQVVGIRASPGAAGNVAANLAALGVQTLALSIIGDDGEGYDLARELALRRIATDALIRTSGRHTPTYTKPMMHEPDGRVHELSRLDIVNRSPLPSDLEAQLLDRLYGLVPEVDGVVVGDQVQARNHGVVTDAVRQALSRLAAEHPDRVMAVDSRTRIGEYRGLVLKPNDREALLGAYGEATDDGTVPLERAAAAGQALSARAGRAAFVTVGARGTLVCTSDRYSRVPAVPVRGEIDIVGAGDSTIAGISAALAVGATPEEAALVGNLVASVTIRQIGTTGTASQQDVLAAFSEWHAKD